MQNTKLYPTPLTSSSIVVATTVLIWFSYSWKMALQKMVNRMMKAKHSHGLSRFSFLEAAPNRRRIQFKRQATATEN